MVLKEENIWSKNTDERQQRLRNTSRGWVCVKETAELSVLDLFVQNTALHVLEFLERHCYLATSPVINRPEEAYGCCLGLSHFFKFLSVLQVSLIFLEKLTETCYASLHTHCLFRTTFSHLSQRWWSERSFKATGKWRSQNKSGSYCRKCFLLVLFI